MAGRYSGPALHLQRGFATLTPTSTTAPSAGTDRGTAFQVLADGTQDLAALVGLFATDSVERYAFDFSRGFLPVAMSTCSLLGLLGYCRALLKPAMGSHACEQSAFPTVALRPYMGVAARDRLPSDELTDVRYLERQKLEGKVEWRIVKVLKHTDESMPLTANRRGSSHRTSEYSFHELILRADKNIMRTRLGFLWVPGSMMATAGATSFLILPFSHGFSWTRFYSTFGLFASLLWSSRWGGGLVQDAKSQPGMSLERKDSFAFYQYKRIFFIFNCRGVHGNQEKAFRIVSFAAALSTVIAYVCQYVELRRLTVTWSGVWLAIQGLLALIRITLWILQPSFQSFEADKATLVYAQGDQFTKSFTETELVVIWSALHVDDQQRDSSRLLLKRLTIPNWIAANLDNCTLPEVFALASRMREGTAEPSEVEACQKSPLWWDLPDGVFGFWLRLRCNEDFKTGAREMNSIRPESDQLWMSASCRIISDPSGRLHFFPGLSSLSPAHHAQSDVYDSAVVYTFSENVRGNAFSFPRLEQRLPTGRQRFYRNSEEAESDGVELIRSPIQDLLNLSQEMLAAIDKACGGRPSGGSMEITNPNETNVEPKQPNLALSETADHLGS
ncbi:MAG: hypothetical protein M1839_006243 [Geoglossum umbratile]|nr:MAG: hypothetical protein M1839_006243 [Geoglossum umbratile]